MRGLGGKKTRIKGGCEMPLFNECRASGKCPDKEFQADIWSGFGVNE